MPTGLGNNESKVDLSLLLTSSCNGDDTLSFAPDDTTEGPGSPTGSMAPVVNIDDDSNSDLPPPALLAAPSYANASHPSPVLILSSLRRRRRRPSHRLAFYSQLP
jgi:hypothetical protein